MVRKENKLPSFISIPYFKLTILAYLNVKCLMLEKKGLCFIKFKTTPNPRFQFKKK